MVHLTSLDTAFYTRQSYAQLPGRGVRHPSSSPSKASKKKSSVTPDRTQCVYTRRLRTWNKSTVMFKSKLSLTGTLDARSSRSSATLGIAVRSARSVFLVLPLIGSEAGTA